MGPGLSWYLVKFKFESFWYVWSEKQQGYFNFTTQRVYQIPPVGSEWDNTCFQSSWRMMGDEEDDDEYYD